MLTFLLTSCNPSRRFAVYAKKGWTPVDLYTCDDGEIAPAFLRVLRAHLRGAGLRDQWSTDTFEVQNLRGLCSSLGVPLDPRLHRDTSVGL